MVETLCLRCQPELQKPCERSESGVAQSNGNELFLAAAMRTRLLQIYPEWYVVVRTF